jgi:hypothetical protein
MEIFKADFWTSLPASEASRSGKHGDEALVVVWDSWHSKSSAVHRGLNIRKKTFNQSGFLRKTQHFPL